MTRFLIDANLPYHFAQWRGDDFSMFVIWATTCPTPQSGNMQKSTISSSSARRQIFLIGSCRLSDLELLSEKFSRCVMK